VDYDTPLHPRNNHQVQLKAVGCGHAPDLLRRRDGESATDGETYLSPAPLVFVSAGQISLRTFSGVEK